MRAHLISLALLTMAVLAAPLLLVHADAGYDGALFSATNGDRATACGQPALGWSGAMASIAQQRVEFIASSGDFTNRNEPGVSAENIGWTSGTTDAVASAQRINVDYMNSPEHRVNICNGRYTSVGIGSVFVASWQGQSDVWIDAEEFAGSAPSRPPAPHASPTPTHSAAIPAPGVPSTGGAAL